jgi:ribosomal protein S18 acetylase RimI-like enzyme
MRPATEADLDALVEMFNRESVNLTGTEQYTADDIRTEWTSPGFSLDKDTRIIDGSSGPVGYVEVWNTSKPYVRPVAWHSIDPSVTSDEPAQQLLLWAKERALEKLGLAPPDARVIFQTFALEQDTAAIRRITGLGMTEQRRYYRMEIELTDEIIPPAIPDGYTIRTMRPGEERSTYHVIHLAFADHYGRPRDTDEEEQFTDWKHYFTDNDEFDPQLAFVAEDSCGELVGASICWPRLGPQTDLGWIEELGVVPDHRRRGLAEALLRHSFIAFKKRGNARAGLGVDATSLTGATRLYERCGMRVVRTNISYETELRAGIDYRKQ